MIALCDQEFNKRDWDGAIGSVSQIRVSLRGFHKPINVCMGNQSLNKQYSNLAWFSHGSSDDRCTIMGKCDFFVIKTGASSCAGGTF